MSHENYVPDSLQVENNVDNITQITLPLMKFVVKGFIFLQVNTLQHKNTKSVPIFYKRKNLQQYSKYGSQRNEEADSNISDLQNILTLLQKNNHTKSCFMLNTKKSAQYFNTCVTE